ncbi:MAG: IS66 family insertion sequence element accessory protein TnpB [Polyangiaceae bacterium]|jgi:transposase|nr:IS66 family insertion sequence element accessory protein TnpB [Polyangiaceae bacterium]
MLQLTAQTRIFVALEPTDFRRGIDGLCRVCRVELSSDPFCGALFVFRNRGATAIRVLAYDGQGFWLCTKRMSKGRFQHWPTATSDGATQRRLLAHELQVLLIGGDPQTVRAAPDWRPLAD